MAYECKILLDSAYLSTPDWSAPVTIRLTTFQITFPRIVLAEFNTHSAVVRNSASTRAQPTAKMIQQVMDDPFIPFFWGKNQPGMSASEELPAEQHEALTSQWLEGRDAAVKQAKTLLDMGLHKQLAGRGLETYMYHTVICSATEWDNFFKLRCHPDAQPEIKRIADMMKEQREASVPRKIRQGDWHIPMVTDEERQSLPIDTLLKIATGRIARVSYMTHDGVRDIAKDIELHDRLIASGHWSPFAHCAKVTTLRDYRRSQFDYPFVQYRKFWHGETGRKSDNKTGLRMGL